MKTVEVFITTYNRLELLKKVVDGVENQTYPLNLTVIVNGSEDGTQKWLDEKGINYIEQPNVGSSGGQFTAVETGRSRNCDYIWIMDDDVVARKGCLAELVEQSEKLSQNGNQDTIVAPLRIGSDGEIFYNEPKTLNLTNPVKSIWGPIINSEDIKLPFVAAEGLTFEGPLIAKNLALKISLPEFKFFIHADDTEYMVKAKKAGALLGIASNANMDRLLPVPDINKQFSWKHYYVIRNIIAIDVLHGSLSVRLLRPWFYLQAWLRRSNNFSDVKTSLKAFTHGYSYKGLTESEISIKLNK